MDQTTYFLARRALPLRQQAKIILAVGLVLLAILLVIWIASRSHGGGVEAAPMTADRRLRLTTSQLASLTIQPVMFVDFRSEQLADGSIALNSDTSTQVFSPYSGRIVRVIAGLGEHVKRGAPLFSIEASELAQAQTDLRNAASQLKLARIAEARRHAAFESKGGSLQDWQLAQGELAAAENALDLVRNRLRILGAPDAQVAAFERARQPNPVTPVVAPIDGVVTDRQIGPGQFLQSGGSTPLYTIGDLSTVWLVAEVREIDAPAVRVGQVVEVNVLALPQRVFHARLTEVGATVDPVTRRVPVRAVIDNPEGMLKPQMFASFSIITSEPSRSLAVPEEAIVREGDTARVWVLEPDNSLALRRIHTGRINGGSVEVLDGLHPDERVVTRGSLFIDRAAQAG